MELIYDKNNEYLTISDIHYENNKVIKPLMELEYKEFFNGEGRIYLLKESDILLHFVILQKSGWIDKETEENNIFNIIGEGTVFFDGIRHSNFFDKGYVHYLESDIDFIIEMFKKIRDLKEINKIYEKD